MKSRITIIFFMAVTLVYLNSCSSTPKRLNFAEDIVADSGELTPYELEKSAKNLAKLIAGHFKKHPNKDGVFVALLPTKNNTSEVIPVKVFDNTLVTELRKKGIYTVRTESRKQSLKEIEFSMSGMTENELSIGKMKSPNYFIKTDIDENIYSYKGDKIVEQVINIELREVTTQLVRWSDSVKYRKKAVSSGGVGW